MITIGTGFKYVKKQFVDGRWKYFYPEDMTAQNASNSSQQKTPQDYRSDLAKKAVELYNQRRTQGVVSSAKSEDKDKKKTSKSGSSKKSKSKGKGRSSDKKKSKSKSKSNKRSSKNDRDTFKSDNSSEKIYRKVLSSLGSATVKSLNSKNVKNNARVKQALLNAGIDPSQAANEELLKYAAKSKK